MKNETLMIDSNAYLRVLVSGMRSLDLLAMVLCFAGAAIAVSPELQYVGIAEFAQLRLQAGNVVFFMGFMLIWATILQSFSVYADPELVLFRRTIFAFAKGVTAGTAALAILGMIIDISFVDTLFIIVFWFTTLVSGIAIRALFTFVLSNRRQRARNHLEYVIVGINPRSVRLAESLAQDRRQSRKFLGFVDASGDSHPVESQRHSQKYLTDLENLPEYMRHTPIDEVIVCLPLKSYYDETMKIVTCCEEQGVNVKVLADIFQTRMTHSRIEHLGNQSVISVASHDIRGFPALAKRAVDIAVSGTLLITLSPLLLATALAVLVTSPGPALFSQKRVGLNKKMFNVLKFRTMVADAEVRQAALESMNEAQGPAFKIQKDPRITSIGSFLRKSSIDELPQLINVLKGDMSLVGPRPLPMRDYAGFEEDWHRRRLSVRPGITGLWQVKDRNHASFDKWMKLDMMYIDQWSLWLDIKIILMTIPAVLRGSGE